MADNVDFQSATPATPAAGTKVATEEITTLNGGAVPAQQVQRVALVLLTANGVGADVPGSSALGMGVNLLTTLSEANDSVTGHIGGFSTVVDVTVTRPANTTPYSAGDEVGTLQTIAAGRSNGASGILTGMTLIYSNNPTVTPTFEVYFFDASITTAGDNAVWAPSDADLGLSLGVITLPSPKVGTTGTSGNLLYSSDPVSFPYVCAGGSNSIFSLIIARTAFTPIANSETLKCRYRLERN